MNAVIGWDILRGRMPRRTSEDDIIAALDATRYSRDEEYDLPTRDAVVFEARRCAEAHFADRRDVGMAARLIRLGQGAIVTYREDAAWLDALEARARRLAAGCSVFAPLTREEWGPLARHLPKL